jgi:TetR/AcrR family transcriptional repressor of mexJK operon
VATDPARDTGRRRGRPPGRNGAELLAVAREHFVAHGYRGTTMDAVAATAGISKHTLYAEHPSKDALFAAVVRDWVDRGYDALRPQTLALRETADVRTALDALAAALQAGILSRPVLQMRTLVAAEADRFPDVAADYVARSWERNLESLADALAALTARGLLTVDSPRIAAEQFVWLAVGAPLNRLSLRGTAHSEDLAELAELAGQAVETFLSRHGAGG